MLQHQLDLKKIAKQLEETWLRPADWETYHSKVQEIVVDVRCGTYQHRRPTDGQRRRRRGENNNEVIHLSSSISGGSEEEMKEEHSEGGEEDRTELQSQGKIN